MQRYHLEKDHYPDFPYRVKVNYSTTNNHTWIEWLNEYPDPSRYYVNYMWSIQHEALEVQFESEQAASMFALKWS